MPEPVKGTSRYMAGIDGLRAFAVLAVILYHLNYNWAPGGLLGVGIFFVLSGYLITDLLIAQWNKHERLDMKDFWLRRARRLLPALLILLVVVVAWVTFFKPDHLPSMKGDVPAAILYVSNWWLIFQDVSYFEKFGPASPFGHLWSLAVEEQFYLVWPLLLALGLRLIKRRGPLFFITLAAAAISACAMAWMYEPGLDPSRVYYGTDTRVFALLIGAALAMVWQSRKLSANISRSGRNALDTAGVVGLAILLAAIWKTNQYDDFLYRGGLVLLSVVSAMVVATLAHPASRFARLMGCKPLKWLGVRSYGIYLWHYPVIVLTSPAGEQGDAFSIPLAVLQVVICIVIAALSWKYVEEPIRHGALGRIWASLKPQRDGKKRRYTRLVASACALVLCVTYFGIASLTSDATASQMSVEENKAEPVKPAPQPSMQPSKPMGPVLPAKTSTEQAKPNESSKKTDAAGQTKPDKKPAPPKEKAPVTAPETPALPVKESPAAPDKAAENQTGQTDESAEKQEGQVQSGKGITALGDSVMLDVAPYLEKLLPGIVIDAKIGRQMSQAPDVVANLKAKGQLGNIVIIELGTNGSFSQKQLLKLLQSLDGADHIILVNTRVPKPWESVVNNTLADVAASNPHIVLLDWYAASAGKDSFFYKDGVHLNPEGSQFYADFLAKAIAKVSEDPKK
ncbi:acyltransferase family protein [Brevibacillus choshinensis]|uniref:Acyltransferase family protein n=1 Tax=Brevibacillus choshinensis TaxID=54911 RepID=A0ABX7FWG0_BRECH|nr:acyltransferase family protein [Brevibacillus choshinensis]QRG70107.1 acyltransferase family protein [Brevibacillus choshinensis]